MKIKSRSYMQYKYARNKSEEIVFVYKFNLKPICTVCVILKKADYFHYLMIKNSEVIQLYAPLHFDRRKTWIWTFY